MSRPAIFHATFTPILLPSGAAELSPPSQCASLFDAQRSRHFRGRPAASAYGRGRLSALDASCLSSRPRYAADADGFLGTAGEGGRFITFSTQQTLLGR